MNQDYQKEIDSYKVEQIRIFQLNFNLHQSNKNFREDLAYLSQQIKFSSMAIKHSECLFQQFRLIIKLLEGNLYLQGQFSLFLNVLKAFENKDNLNRQITYFVRPRMKPIPQLLSHQLQSIWKIILRLQENQIFIFNLGLQNFCIDLDKNIFIYNLGNSIILKFNEIPQKTKKAEDKGRDEKPVYQNIPLIDELITNSKKLVGSEQFKAFIRQRMDSPHSNKTYNHINISHLYSLHRKQFLNLVKRHVESRSRSTSEYQKRMLVELKSILNIDWGWEYFQKNIFDKQIEQIMDRIMKIRLTQENCQQVTQIYRYPITYYGFKDYTHQQKQILIHSCRKLLRKQEINTDLLQSSFSFILDPRDFFYLSEDIANLYSQQLLEQQNLLHKSGTDNQLVGQLRQIIKASEGQVAGIWESFKRQSCKFNITTADSRTSYDASTLLYRRYFQYERQRNKGDKTCSVHGLEYRYKCECKFDQSPKGCCYYCLQSKHSGHRALCKQHSKPLHFKYIFFWQEADSLEEYTQKDKELQQQFEYFACQTCKEEEKHYQIQYIRICEVHRLPIQYLCFSNSCAQNSAICVQCLRNMHSGHQVDRLEHISEYSSEEDCCVDQQEKKVNQLRIQGALKAAKFQKYRDHYQSKTKPIAVFLDQILNHPQSPSETQKAINKLLGQDDNSQSEDDVLRIKIKKNLSKYSQSSLKEIGQYVADQINSLSDKLFDSIDNLLRQFQTKAGNLIKSDDLLEQAENYLNNKYQTIMNFRNTKMNQCLYPVDFSEEAIQKHHYDRIKKVVIDAATEKENKEQQKQYLEQVKKKWVEFYNGEDYAKYSQALQNVRILKQNDGLYLKKNIKPQIQKLKQKMSKGSLKDGRQIREKIEYLRNSEGDIHLFEDQMKTIQSKLSKVSIQKSLRTYSQKNKLVHFIQKMPNLRSFQFKLDYSYHQDPSTDLMTIFQHLPNLSHFSYSYSANNIEDIQFKNMDELFNKKIYLCINTKQLDLQDLYSKKKQIIRINRNMKFGCQAVQTFSDLENKHRPNFIKFKSICESTNQFGVTSFYNKFEKHIVDQSWRISSKHMNFTYSMFNHIATKSSLLKLHLNGLIFSPRLNQLFSQLLSSNSKLQQLQLNCCLQFGEDNFIHLNNNIRTLQLNNLKFKDNDGFKGICFSKLLKLSYLTIQQIQFSHQFFEYFSRNKVSFESTLIKLQMRLNSIGLLYNQQTRLFQDHSVKQFIEIFKNCSLHQLATECDYPEYLTRLETDELTSLKLFQCHKLTQSSLFRIDRKWPNLRELILSGCHLKIKEWRIRQILKKAQIVVDHHFISQKQLKDLRLHGVNIKLFETDPKEL